MVYNEQLVAERIAEMNSSMYEKSSVTQNRNS